MFLRPGYVQELKIQTLRVFLRPGHVQEFKIQRRDVRDVKDVLPMYTFCVHLPRLSTPTVSFRALLKRKEEAACVHRSVLLEFTNFALDCFCHM